MFPQFIHSTQLNTPCLQTIQKEDNALRLFVFEEDTTRRVRRLFYEANIVGLPCKRGNIVALRFPGHRTIEMLGIVGPKV